MVQVLILQRTLYRLWPLLVKSHDFTFISQADKAVTIYFNPNNDLVLTDDTIIHGITAGNGEERFETARGVTLAPGEYVTVQLAAAAVDGDADNNTVTFNVESTHTAAAGAVLVFSTGTIQNDGTNI